MVLEMECPADIIALSERRGAIRSWLYHETGDSENATEAVIDFVMALGELFSNVKHANLQPSETVKVKVEVLRGEIRSQIIHRGMPTDNAILEQAKMPADSLATSGRGLAMLPRLCQEVNFSPEGCQLVRRFN